MLISPSFRPTTAVSSRTSNVAEPLAATLDGNAPASENPAGNDARDVVSGTAPRLAIVNVFVTAAPPAATLPKSIGVTRLSRTYVDPSWNDASGTPPLATT